MPAAVAARRVAQGGFFHPGRLKICNKPPARYIARKLRCEGAVVSSGLSAGPDLAAAALHRIGTCLRRTKFREEPSIA